MLSVVSALEPQKGGGNLLMTGKDAAHVGGYPVGILVETDGWDERPVTEESKTVTGKCKCSRESANGSRHQNFRRNNSSVIGTRGGAVAQRAEPQTPDPDPTTSHVPAKTLC